MSKAFISHPISHGLLADLSDDKYPTQISCWDGRLLRLADIGTHFGFVWRGRVTLDTSNVGSFTLQTGMYFSLPSSGILVGDGQGIIITRLNYKGIFNIGGSIEPQGRLLYINGATDTLLIPPVMKGDPCLNALYFPPRITQTPHTHPSMRVGIIVSGRGECVTREEVIPLEPGQLFVIPAGSLHSFRTTNNPLTAIAYHPDSDYGSTHEQHPMISRTWVNGISASYLEEIRTRG